MKLIAVFTLFLLFLTSCNKENVEPIPEPDITPSAPNECIVIGDSVSSNVHFVHYYPFITLNSHNSIEIHEIDINSDGTNDFQFNLYSYLPLAGNWFKGSTIKIKALHPNAEISMNSLYADSVLFYPHQYELNDSLEQQSLWESDEFYISHNGDDMSDPCNSPGCPMVSYGPWFGQSNKYIGIRMSGAVLGWIRISLPTTDPHFKQKLIIEGYACVP